MIGAGLLLLPGVRPPRRTAHPAIAALSTVAFTRLRLGDLGGAMRVMEPLLGWLYTRPGAVVLAALLLAAAASWAGRGAEIAAHAARLADFDLSDLMAGYLIFVAAKLLHECGHAVALRRMAAAEGLPRGALPWGVSFMFLMPAPYVDASAAWFVADPRRRAAVGLAGVATDLLVAALAALLWAGLGPGWLSDRAFDLVVICGVSSLLFNLNPLVKLDGYYVLSDLAGLPNLMARAQAALGRLVFGPFGLADRPAAGDLPSGSMPRHPGPIAGPSTFRSSGWRGACTGCWRAVSRRWWRCCSWRCPCSGSRGWRRAPSGARRPAPRSSSRRWRGCSAPSPSCRCHAT